MTDSGLESLAEYKQLQLLDLQETRITDAGLRHIADLTQLRFLKLGNISGNSGITDAGLKHLTNLSRLHHLSFRYLRAGEVKAFKIC